MSCIFNYLSVYCPCGILGVLDNNSLVNPKLAWSHISLGFTFLVRSTSLVLFFPWLGLLLYCLSISIDGIFSMGSVSDLPQRKRVFLRISSPLKISCLEPFHFLMRILTTLTEDSARPLTLHILDWMFFGWIASLWKMIDNFWIYAVNHCPISLLLLSHFWKRLPWLHV